MSPILGFSPDADPTAAGILLDCANVIPFEAGFQSAPAPQAVQTPPLAGACQGAAVLAKLDGTRRMFAGTASSLYELTGAAWTSRGSGYATATDGRWSFCQFGDTSIASNYADPMQQATTGAFSAVAGGAPKAKIVVSASNNFVIAFNTNDGTYGVNPDRWWCCAQNNQADWAPSVATGATTGRLIAREGPITAALPLGDYVIAYKGRAVFLGAFVGSNAGTWQWTNIVSSECGAVGQDAVCNIGGVHFIVGEDDFWLFDGTRPISIGDGVLRDWFRRNSSQVYRYRTKVAYDRQRNCVWINYPTSASTTGVTDATLVYHVGTKRWGRSDRIMEAALNFIAPGTTINGLDAYAGTIDALPAIPFDSQYWLSGGRLFAYFDSSHQLVANTGTGLPSSITTCDMGTEEQVSTLDQFRVRYTFGPATATATALIFMNEGDTPINGPTCPINEGKFDLLQSARFHRVRVDHTGNMRATSYAPKFLTNGRR